MEPTPEDLVEGPWAIYAGADMAILILQNDPELSRITRLMVRKRHWESVTRWQAHAVFNRLLAGGHLGAWGLTAAKKTDRPPEGGVDGEEDESDEGHDGGADAESPEE